MQVIFPSKTHITNNCDNTVYSGYSGQDGDLEVTWITPIWKLQKKKGKMDITFSITVNVNLYNFQ